MSTNIDIYQAACFLGISPELLTYFTENTVKKNDARKLQVARRDGNTLFFDEHELRAYNDWLFLPWPAEPNIRPHLPSAIKRDVKAEASGECAICSNNANSCEAAHIVPVSKTKCNHPHNLLWLCANHHTKFDNGSLGPKGVDNELVKATKVVRQHARRHIWQQSAAVTTQIAALLKLAKDTIAHLQNATSESNAEVAEGVGKKVLELLSTVTAKNKVKSQASILSRISIVLETPAAIGGDVATTADKLGMVASFEEEFRHEAGLKYCPLCSGTRWHNEQECPVCQGEGTVAEDFKFDPSPYKLVTCRLCKGKRRIDGEDCPACGGEGQLEARFDERIDWLSFDKVTCRLCKGKRRIDGEDCPACGGEGQLEARFDERTDWSSFDKVTCRLCKGNRRWKGADCPVCRGEGELTRGCLDAIDLSDYSDVKCPLCKGSGNFKSETCPECSGEGKMEQWRAESVNVSDYQLED